MSYQFDTATLNTAARVKREPNAAPARLLVRRANRQARRANRAI